MAGQNRRDDILLESPVAAHADVVRAVEDRSYLAFIGGAIAVATVGGFALAVLVSLAGAGLFWEGRVPWLIQAHGWAQLEGWAGLFVAGMGLRLLPRFAGQRPLDRRLNLGIFALLVSGVAVRTVAQLFAGDGLSAAGFMVGQVLWAAGAAAFAVVLARILLRGRGHREPWSVFAFAGAAWWLAWAAASVSAGVRGARNEAYVTPLFDDPLTWVVMLGAIGSFIWAVQSRSVPIFFGRKTPTLRQVAAPGVLLNAGIGLIFVASWLDDTDVRGPMVGLGFVLSGAGLAWIAPVAGACWGTPTRLRPGARAAARFVLGANLSAVACGLLLVWTGVDTLANGEFSAPGARDAARHAFGVGVITLLIIGMAQLVAPFFALRRVEPKGAWVLDRAVLWLLVSATVLRMASGLMWDHTSTETRLHVSAGAGTLAWVALVLFGMTVVRAIRDEPGIKASLAVSATQGTGPRRKR